MDVFDASPFRDGKAAPNAFTLIELLIVIAIILILIAIALPNFLEAQERARVTRANGHLRTMETAVMSHYVDYNMLYSDYNDGTPLTWLTRNKAQVPSTPCPTIEPPWRSSGGIDFSPGGGSGFQQTFYAGNLHCPLTSPIKYVEATSVVDPWSDGTIPVGMDSRCFNCGGNSNPDNIHYSAYFVSGPDRRSGDWLSRIPYSPTNGTKSVGDLWFIVANNTATARAEYGGKLKTF